MQTPHGMNGPNRGSGMMAGGDWRASAGEARRALLLKLKEALMSQNDPTPQDTAARVDHEAFVASNSLEDYKFR